MAGNSNNNNQEQTPSQTPSQAFEQAFRRGRGEYPAVPEAPLSKRNLRPRPKTQQEIARDIPEPYELAGLENPNKQPNPNEQATGISFNRSEKISLKDDATKSYKIGVQDIDEAVFYYFNNVIQPEVMQNGGPISVPVIYGSPERWKSVQKDGYYRDKGGRIMLPIIVVQRTNLEKDRSVTAKVDSNHPYQYYNLSKGYNSKNFYNTFDLINNRIPVEQEQLIVVGDFVTMTYECVMQTYYMEQLNKLIESIEYASDSYWGDPERYKFRCFIDNFGSTTELSQSTERLVRGNFTIRLRGQIIPEVKQKSFTALRAINSKAKFTLTTETAVDISGNRIVLENNGEPLPNVTNTGSAPSPSPTLYYTLRRCDDSTETWRSNQDTGSLSLNINDRVTDGIRTYVVSGYGSTGGNVGDVTATGDIGCPPPPTYYSLRRCSDVTETWRTGQTTGSVSFAINSRVTASNGQIYAVTGYTQTGSNVGFVSQVTGEGCPAPYESYGLWVEVANIFSASFNSNPLDPNLLRVVTSEAGVYDDARDNRARNGLTGSGVTIVENPIVGNYVWNTRPAGYYVEFEVGGTEYGPYLYNMRSSLFPTPSGSAEVGTSNIRYDNTTVPPTYNLFGTLEFNTASYDGTTLDPAVLNIGNGDKVRIYKPDITIDYLTNPI